MAEVQEVRQLPAEYIEALGKTYADQLTKDVGGLRSIDLTKLYGPSFVAGPGAFTTQAEGLAGGLGSYAPFLQAAQAATGPTAYQQYMSPYQQDVINTALQEYDVQAQKGAQAIPAAAIAAGAFGGGREGVQRSEYQATSDRNRAALQAQLLQQGFGQAQQLAGQAFGQQQNLSTQQQQLATQQMQLAQQAPALASSQIAGLTTLGGLQQAQEQAGLSAQQQLAQQQMMQPLTAAQQYGAGIASLISGYPASQMTQTQPSPSPLQTGISAGATLAGLYRAFGNQNT